MIYKYYNKLINKIAWFIPIKKHRDTFREILLDIVHTMYKIDNINKMSNRVNSSICNDDFVVINCNSGLSDQLYHYFLGEYITNNYNRKVKYDISWFKYNGKDDNKNDSRNFCLLDMLPDANFEVLNEDEANYYKICFSKSFSTDYNIAINDLDFYLKNYKKIYIDFFPKLYGNIVLDIIKDIDLDKYILPKLNSKTLYLHDEIVKHDASVAVHVRLGDVNVMKSFKEKFNSNYEEYAKAFINAIYDLKDKLYPLKPKFFFFSNNINWVLDNIINKLNNDIEYDISNDKNEPYIDMYLLSCSKHYIISCGAFGITATLFNKNPNKIIIDI